MSFELILTYQKMVTFWTYAGESGTTLTSMNIRPIVYGMGCLKSCNLDPTYDKTSPAVIKLFSCSRQYHAYYC